MIIEGISSSQFSLGWVGYAFAQEATDAGKSKMLQVSREDGGDCVSPTPETIASAEFPIARFLYTYINIDSAANDPSIAGFVDYMMSEDGLTAVTEVGYVALPDADGADVLEAWETRTPGRQ